MGRLDPDLLKRYANGNCTEEEKTLVEDWLENGEDDDVRFENIALENEIWEGIVGQASPVRSVGGIRRYGYLLAAASILIVLGFIFLYAAPSGDRLVAMKTLQVPMGQKVTLKLADESTVELSGGSSIRYPESFEGNSRAVTLLEGEAFFSVVHNTAKPFLVHTSGSSIRVLGTKFNVENARKADQLSVTLTQGSISFQTGVGKSALLKPGQQLVFLKKQRMISSVLSIDTNRVTSWTRGELWFDHTPLSGVLDKLERHYGVTFNNSKQLHLDDLVTAKFHSQPLSRVLRLMENFTDLRFIQKGKQVDIYTSIP